MLQLPLNSEVARKLGSHANTCVLLGLCCAPAPGATGCSERGQVHPLLGSSARRVSRVGSGRASHAASGAAARSWIPA